jgi:hypothetical protein
LEGRETATATKRQPIRNTQPKIKNSMKPPEEKKGRGHCAPYLKVRAARFELAILSALVPKTSVYAIPPHPHKITKD